MTVNQATQTLRHIGRDNKHIANWSNDHRPGEPGTRGFFVYLVRYNERGVAEVASDKVRVPSWHDDIAAFAAVEWLEDGQ